MHEVLEGGVAESPSDLVEQLFEAFNRRFEERIRALCGEQVQFTAVTAEATGRSGPYVGHEGLRDYLADVGRVWEELQVSAGEVREHGDLLLVIGRVYARSREQGMRDLPAAWIWRLHEGRFVYGRVYAEPQQAIAALAAAREPIGPL